MDGVISDTQKLHSRAEADILAGCGVEVEPDEITRRFAGVRMKDFFGELLGEKAASRDMDELIKEKWERMKRLASVSVDEVPGSRKLIKTLADGGYGLAVASASNRDYVDRVLDALDVKRYFRAIVGGDMVEKGKPDPEIFLLAAEKIKIAPENCLVIEDGISGMEGAKRAGMECIGLVERPAGDYPTKNLVSGLEEITPEYINSLRK